MRFLLGLFWFVQEVVRGVLHGHGLLGGQCVRCARVLVGFVWFGDLGLGVGWGIFAFSSTLIRWSTCVALMVPFMGLRVHCWYWSVSCRRVTTHVVLRAWTVIPGFCNRT